MSDVFRGVRHGGGFQLNSAGSCYFVFTGVLNFGPK